MAHIYSSSRLHIQRRMATDKEHEKWLFTATFAKTDNGYWLAWKPAADGRIMDVTYLKPDHPKGEPPGEIETWDGWTVEELIAYFESGEIEINPPGVLNLFIEGEDF